MARIFISLIFAAVLVLMTSCGAQDIERVGKKAEKHEHPKTFEASSDQDQSPSELHDTPAPEEDKTKQDDTPEKDDNKEEKQPEKAKKPPIGWLDSGTGYRFVLLEGDDTYSVVDVETDVFTAYIDLTPDQRQDAEEARQAGLGNAISVLTVFYPTYGVYAQMAQQLAGSLDAVGAQLKDPNRRKSLCERKLGAGWHYPNDTIVTNADEDEITKNIKDLVGKNVWLTQGLIWGPRVYEFKKDDTPNQQTNVLFDQKNASLCVIKSL